MKKATKQPRGALKLLDFTASWCGPCQSMKPVLKKFEAAHPEIPVEAVDIDRNERRCRTYDVNCVPTFVLLRGRTVVGRLEGACPLSELNRLLARA